MCGRWWITPRNLTDAELDAIAHIGGVVNVTPFNPYLRPLAADFDAQAAVLRRKCGLPPTNRHGPVGAEERINTLWVLRGRHRAVI